MSEIKVFRNHLRREWLSQIRQPYQLINPCLFYLMIIIFFPLTLPVQNLLLRSIVPGVVWTATLLALLMAADRLFQQDFEEGVVEQWLISGFPLPLIITAKLTVHWLIFIIPILLLCPIVALLFRLTSYEMLVMMASLSAGSPAILGLCALAASCSIGMQQRSIFMALILLPLTVPIMIFGSGALTAAIHALPISGYIALLIAMSLVAVALLPIASAAIIRISLSG